MKQEKENVGSKDSERLRKRQATMPHRPVKIPRLLEAQQRKYGSILHSANCSATWPFSTPEATLEVQVLTFSFLFQGCELRNTCYSFTSVRALSSTNTGRVA